MTALLYYAHVIAVRENRIKVSLSNFCPGVPPRFTPWVATPNGQPELDELLIVAFPNIDLFAGLILYNFGPRSQTLDSQHQPLKYLTLNNFQQVPFNAPSAQRILEILIEANP